MNMGKIAYVDTKEIKDSGGKKVGEISEGEWGGFFVCVNPDCPDCHSSHKRE